MSNYRKDPRINASLLKLFTGKDFSPIMALHKMRNPTPPSPAMQLGTALHSWLEHLGKFGPSTIVSPYDNYRTKEAQLWRDANSDKVILTTDEVTKVEAMGTNVINSPLRKMIIDIDAQREVEYYDDEYKALLDVVYMSSGIDYKTTACTSAEQFKRDIYKYGYALQAYHYLRVAKLSNFYFIGVSTVDPYEVFTMYCTSEFLKYGQKCWQEALDRYKYFTVNAPKQEIINLDAPLWAAIEDEDDF